MPQGGRVVVQPFVGGVIVSGTMDGVYKYQLHSGQLQSRAYLDKLDSLLVPAEEDLPSHLAASKLEVALDQTLQGTHILILLEHSTTQHSTPQHSARPYISAVLT